MIAADADLFNSFVHGPKATAHLRTVGIGKLVWKGDEILFFGEHVLRHSAIALPAVGTTIFFTGAGDHVAATAVIAYAATGDMVDDNPIAHIEASAARAHFDDLATGFVAGDHALIPLRPLPKMFVINGANIRAADCRSFDPEQNLAMIGHRHWHGAKFNSTVSRKVCGLHLLLHVFSSPSSSYMKCCRTRIGVRPE